MRNYQKMSLLTEQIFLHMNSPLTSVFFSFFCYVLKSVFTYNQILCAGFILKGIRPQDKFVKVKEGLTKKGFFNKHHYWDLEYLNGRTCSGGRG